MLLKNCVPAFVSEDIEEFKIIYKIQQEEIDRLNLEINESLAQFFVNKATVGIKDWETFVGVISDSSKELEERQAIVMAKLRGQGTSTVEVIETVAQSFVKDDKVTVIEDNPNSSFIIDFNSDKVKNLSSIENAIDEIKPAHLDYEISVTEEMNLLLETKIKEYLYPFFMCGTFQCGTKPDATTLGTRVTTELNTVNNNTTTMQKYNMAGAFNTGGDTI